MIPERRSWSGRFETVPEIWDPQPAELPERNRPQGFRCWSQLQLTPRFPETVQLFYKRYGGGDSPGILEAGLLS